MKWRVSFVVTWPRVAIGIAAAAAIVVAGALAVAWSGAYSVAASNGHQPWIEAFIRLGLTRSIAANARAPEPFEFVAPDDLVPLGALHYRTGCARCHGAPGDPVDPVSAHMLPRPPDLSGRVGEWSDDELHWIVANGIQFTGMPSWPGEDRPHEVWAIVAFLRAMPTMSPEQYRALSAAPDARRVERAITAGAIAACASCHGDAERPPPSPLAPRLNGLSETYLTRALLEYKAGVRESGFMEPVAARLTPEQIRDLARTYAALASPPADADGGANELGRVVADRGLPRKVVPACDSCHDGSARPTYPTLAGQDRAYLLTQLELWKRGGRADTPYGRTMAAIAGRLTQAEMEAVSAHYAAQPARAAP